MKKNKNKKILLNQLAIFLRSSISHSIWIRLQRDGAISNEQIIHKQNFNYFFYGSSLILSATLYVRDTSIIYIYHLLWSNDFAIYIA